MQKISYNSETDNYTVTTHNRELFNSIKKMLTDSGVSYDTVSEDLQGFLEQHYTLEVAGTSLFMEMDQIDEMLSKHGPVERIKDAAVA